MYSNIFNCSGLYRVFPREFYFIYRDARRFMMDLLAMSQLVFVSWSGRKFCIIEIQNEKKINDTVYRVSDPCHVSSFYLHR